MNQKQNRTKWILRILISIIFVAVGIGKLLGGQMVAMQTGFPLWFLQFVALSELAGIAGIYISKFSSAALTCLSAVMVGAFLTNIETGQGAVSVVPVAIFGLLMWLLSLEEDALSPSPNF